MHETIKVISPVNEELIKELQVHTSEDVRKAVITMLAIKVIFVRVFIKIPG